MINEKKRKTKKRKWERTRQVRERFFHHRKETAIFDLNKKRTRRFKGTPGREGKNWVGSRGAWNLIRCRAVLF